MKDVIKDIIHIMEVTDVTNMELGLHKDTTTNDEAEIGFDPKDYVLAKRLVAQVGGPERAKQLIDNLEEVIEILDLDDKHISTIARNCPEWYSGEYNGLYWAVVFHLRRFSCKI